MLEITIKLHIPERVQNELVKDIFRETNTEKFYLSIRYGYASPVAVVSSRNSSSAANGSSFIQLVREFFIKTLNDNATMSTKLVFIGPSPFHVDFAIVPVPQIEEKFNLKSNDPIAIEKFEDVGYDKLPGLLTKVDWFSLKLWSKFSKMSFTRLTSTMRYFKGD
jgi:hypothetical protein